MSSKQNIENSKDYFKYYNHLGNIYPYHLSNNLNKLSLNIRDIIKDIPKRKREIDPVGIIEFINKTYLLGNRTLIQNVKCSPWMAKPVEKDWEFSKLPSHQNKEKNISEVVNDFKSALKKEALEYIGDKSTIGILLSGGLDSRIVSGIIRELQLEKSFSGNVVSLTWGLKNSRDVYYAKEITKRFNWDFMHFENGPDQLKKNIEIAGVALGAEVSALHLHSMSEIREVEGLDAIIAGSYGDGVGRAEYSGKHVLNLNPIITRKKYFLNQFGLLKHEVLKQYSAEVLKDAYNYRTKFSKKEVYQYREIEQEMHYMRRKLQRCMSYINEKIPLYQLFTAPDSYKLMWELNPKIRDDRFYKVILKTLPNNIGEIPWARTGMSINSKTNNSDNKTSIHHKYGYWLRNNLKDYIIKLVRNDNIMDLNIFNENTLEKIINLWPKSETVTTNYLDEIILWLASLSIFVEEYSIKSSNNIEESTIDSFNTLIGYGHSIFYQKARNILRK